MPVELQAAVIQMKTKSIRNKEVLTSRKWYSKIIEHFGIDCYQ